MIYLALISRWVHVLSFVTAIGGAIFMRIVLLPAAQTALTDEQRARLREVVIGRWKMIVHPCIALLLLSGSYNFYVALTDRVAPMPYHLLFGLKVIAALGVFFLAIALTSTRSWSVKLRAESGRWLSYLIVLAIVVILLSGALKQIHAPRPPAAARSALAGGAR